MALSVCILSQANGFVLLGFIAPIGDWDGAVMLDVAEEVVVALPLSSMARAATGSGRLAFMEEGPKAGRRRKLVLLAGGPTRFC